MKVFNRQNEALDVLVEGKMDANETIVFAHGRGSNKHENILVNISKELEDKYRIVRFDFSSCGESEGKSEDGDIDKWATDLNAVLEFVRSEFPTSKINILAHSLGGFITANASPDNINKIIMTGIPNSDANFTIERSVKRMIAKGGTIDFEGISTYPRSSGRIDKVGPNYWKALQKFNPLSSVEDLAKKTELTLVHPIQDDVIGNEHMEEYKTVPKVNYIELDGDHSFSTMISRINLINKINEILS
jgi:pimeloyl-ACP methyl ester carboxylesterase